MKGVSIAIAMLLFVAGGLNAQLIDGKQIVTAELVNGGVDESGSIVLGLRFTIEPGWYLYWKNPGDSGLPVAVSWELPPGFSVGELMFPTPQRFDYEGIVAYGYKNEVVLIAKLNPAGDLLTSSTVKAGLDWLVCKESCIRGTATVELPLDARPVGIKHIGRFWQQLPRPLKEAGLEIKRAGVARDSKRLIVTVEFAGPNAARIADFFPEVVDDAVIDFQSIRVRDGALTLAIEPYTDNARLNSLKGLVIVDGKGYECVLKFDSM